MPFIEAADYTEDSLVKLTGYTSTSKQFEKALEFAMADCSSEEVPVVFEIYFRGTSGLFELENAITAYPGEEEVLL